MYSMESHQFTSIIGSNRLVKRARPCVEKNPILKRCRTEPTRYSQEEDSGSSDIEDACSICPCSARGTLPARFMYYQQGEWTVFPKAAVEVLKKSFSDGKVSAEVLLWGCLYVINFVLMMQISTRTGYRRSIAWIDEKGRCFSPPFPFECSWNGFVAKFPFTWVDSEKGRTDFEGLQMSSDEIEPTVSPEQKQLVVKSYSSSKDSCGFALLDDKLITLDEGSEEHEVILKKFSAGLGVLAEGTIVAAIYRNKHSTTSGKARKLAFERHVESIKEIQRDPNVKLGWHGTCKQGVSGIILHGFGQPNIPKSSAAYGIGVYLAPEDCSHVSALYSDIDENGEQHVVLCQVILGRTELVHQRSTQFHPSSETYDTGVDNTLHPKRYIVWSTHMNTHLLPLYVVSYKLSPQSHDILLAMKQGSSRNGLSSMSYDQPALQVELAPAQDKMETIDIMVFCCWPGSPVCGNPAMSWKEFKQKELCWMACAIQKHEPLRPSLKGDRVGKAYVPRSPWMSFSVLFSILRREMPCADLFLLQQDYAEFKAGRMSREELVNKLRQVAGDKMLREAMSMMQTQAPLVQKQSLNPESACVADLSG